MAKLLVVDDSRLTRKLVSKALREAGHDCTEATNGREGLAAFQETTPDVVFSDLLMPEMDGFEMTAAIRELDPSVPIVVATADIQESSRERCAEIGVTLMLNKPLKPHEIADAVRSALESSPSPLTEV